MEWRKEIRPSVKHLIAFLNLASALWPSCRARTIKEFLDSIFFHLKTQIKISVGKQA